MEQQQQKLCTPLPASVNKRIGTCASSEQYITNFLQNVLPSSDTKSIDDELKKSFTFNKHKSKVGGRKNRGKLLSNKKRMELGLRKIGCRSGMKYTDLLPLNALWQKYMQEMLGNQFFNNVPSDPVDPNWENVNLQLIKADYHGAEISIVRSKCPSLVGLGGIVIQDTKNAFRICGRDDIVRTIPKNIILMDIFLGQVKLQLFGRELSIRPTERTVKKFKTLRAFEL